MGSDVSIKVGGELNLKPAEPPLPFFNFLNRASSLSTRHTRTPHRTHRPNQHEDQFERAIELAPTDDVDGQ